MFVYLENLLSFLAIPLHLLTAATYIKYRKTEFVGSFFTIAVSLLVNDALLCSNYLVFEASGIWAMTKTPAIIYNGSEKTVDWPKWCHTFVKLSLRDGNQWGITLMAINRFCFIFFPFTADEIWTPKRTTIVVASKWLMSLCIGFGHQPSMKVVYDNSTGVYGLQAPAAANLWNLLSSVSHIGCAFAVFVLYAAMFVKTVKRKLSVGSLVNRDRVELKMALQGCVLALFLLPVGLHSLFFFLSPAPPMLTPGEMPPPPPLFVLFDRIEMANYYSTSMILIASSKITRAQIRKMTVFGTQVHVV